MNPLLHTFIATILLAIAYYYGVYKGRSGDAMHEAYKNGIEDCLTSLSERDLIDIDEVTRDWTK